ncbi:MAG: DUF4270 family protein [Bacteroidetes bacterium]|nr:DUF4270 family protein [Bacteroidota bacterium]
MKRNHSLRLSAIVATALFFIIGCTGETGTTAIDVLPDSDLIGLTYSDTFTIEMETIVIDSFTTYQAGRQIFGNYLDPEFGDISAATYTEVLPRSGLNFGDTANIRYDSIVLRMNIDNYYGRLETPQALVINELTEKFPETDTMYSNDSLAYDAAWNLAGDRVLDFSQQGVDIITVRLDDSLGRRILFANADTLGDKDLFKELFKGFYISTKPLRYFSREPGAIFSLFAASTSTQLEQYYQKRDSASGPFTAKMEPFLISLSTPRFHNFKCKNFNEKIISQYLTQPDQSTFYEVIQGGGIINYVKLPYIKNLGEVLISKAELLLYVETKFLGSNNRFQPPIELESIFADENKQEVIISGTRVLLSDPADFDANEGAYVIRLNNYIQELLIERRENYGFFLAPNNRSFQVNRAIFGGTGHPTLKPVLRVTYTNLPK